MGSGGATGHGPQTRCGSERPGLARGTRVGFYCRTDCHPPRNPPSGDPMASMPKSFTELIRTSDRPVFVDFWAPWCGPCRAVSQVVQQIAREYSDRMATIKINVDEKPDIAQRYQISSIPTLMLFWRGEPVMRLLGAQPVEQIRRQLEASWPTG